MSIACAPNSLCERKLKPTKQSTHLEVANLLAKGFPHMQVGNGVVQDSLHDPVGRTKTLERCLTVLPTASWGGKMPA